MPLIQTAQTTEKVRLQYKVRSPFGLFLAEDLVPVVVVDNLSGASVGDQGYPRDAFGRDSEGVGGAGLNSTVCIAATPDAGPVILHVTGVKVFLGATGTFQVRMIPTLSGWTEGGRTRYQDNREPGDTNAFVGAKTILTASLEGDAIIQQSLLINTTADIPLSCVLQPGQGPLAVNADTAQVLVGVTWFWTEYLLENR